MASGAQRPPEETKQVIVRKDLNESTNCRWWDSARCWTKLLAETIDANIPNDTDKPLFHCDCLLRSVSADIDATLQLPSAGRR